MGFLTNLFQKKQPEEPSLGVQPHKGWPWTLSVSGMPTDNVSWEAIAGALDRLGPHDDSFIILEQKQGDAYWFIQSAVALMGPHTGEYIVGVGWNDAKKGHLIERCGGAREAVDMFRAVWEGRPLDFSGFEDQSDMLPGNS